jgi:hypothetical protein
MCAMRMMQNWIGVYPFEFSGCELRHSSFEASWILRSLCSTSLTVTRISTKTRATRKIVQYIDGGTNPNHMSASKITRNPRLRMLKERAARRVIIMTCVGFRIRNLSPTERFRRSLRLRPNHLLHIRPPIAQVLSHGASHRR